jgi:hypothetical protein
MKDGFSLPRLLRGIALFACICAAAGCTHTNGQPPGFVEAGDAGLLETACEDNLRYLANIIKEFEAKTGTSDALLIEAIEIYRMAESLYLQKEFKLASDWIEDAISILEEPGE